MSQILISIVAFIVALGILVSVHEFGHFWVARKMGVKVLRFSVGFGKPLFRYQRTPDDTEYVLAALPLGGYVKMLDEREGPVEPEELPVAFNTQNVWKRIAIVIAGPMFNFILAVPVYALVFMLGIVDYKPLTGIEENSLAATAGFQQKDQIIAVEGVKTATWQQVRLAVLDTVLDRQIIQFQVLTEQGIQALRTVDLGGHNLLDNQVDILKQIGLKMWWPPTPPVISGLTEGEAAQRAGLQLGDRIISTNGNSISNWMDWVRVVQANPLKKLLVEVERDNKILTLSVVPSRKVEKGQAYGFIGAEAKKPVEAIKQLEVTVRYPLFASITESFSKTVDMTVMIFKMLGKLVTGVASHKNISGPISIAEYAGKSASIGMAYFLELLGMISLSLAVLNLLPIPLLDGGHLFYYLIELVSGSPVSERLQLYGQQMGIIILGGLMALAFYNDIVRLFGQ